MKSLKLAIIPIVLLLSTTAFAQDNQRVVCKGVTIPDGFVVSGETLDDACHGTAWIVKPKRGAPAVLDRMAAAESAATALAEPNEAIAPGQCDSFQQDVRTTYDFDPANLSDAEIKQKSTKLDAFWNRVRQSRIALVPCLRQALKTGKSQSFFNIDGSMLLVEIDPSYASKALQVRKFTEANLDGTDLEYWVSVMARRGVEGFDTSAAGAKWLAYPKAKYNLSMHGGFPVTPFFGAVFIFGSMEEDLATPTLLQIANQIGHPQREAALAILMSQATPAAMRALKEVNTTGLDKTAVEAVRGLLEHPDLLKPRAQPKLTREEQLIAFQGIVDGNYQPFRDMVMKAPDGEVDAVAMLRPEDIPLLRRARRASISRCNQHALSEYSSFTQILWALTAKAESAASTAR